VAAEEGAGGDERGFEFATGGAAGSAGAVVVFEGFAFFLDVVEGVLVGGGFALEKFELTFFGLSFDAVLLSAVAGAFVFFLCGEDLSF